MENKKNNLKLKDVLTVTQMENFRNIISNYYIHIDPFYEDNSVKEIPYIRCHQIPNIIETVEEAINKYQTKTNKEFVATTKRCIQDLNFVKNMKRKA